MIENRICGYSCEHNKGGVCQITMCDKNVKFTTITTADYTKYNFNLPLFETNELEKFDIYIDEIAKDFTQKMLKDKDMILAQRIIKQQQHKIDKAIEYIENNDFGIITFSDRDINGNIVRKIEKGYVKKDELLDILNGRSYK